MYIVVRGDLLLHVWVPSKVQLPILQQSNTSLVTIYVVIVHIVNTSLFFIFGGKGCGGGAARVGRWDAQYWNTVIDWHLIGFSRF